MSYYSSADGSIEFNTPITPERFYELVSNQPYEIIAGRTEFLHDKYRDFLSLNDDLLLGFEVDSDGHLTHPKNYLEDCRRYHDETIFKALAPYLKNTRLCYVGEDGEHWALEIEDGKLFYLDGEITYTNKTEV
ncbi:hypothetical protein [Actinomyces vulturis]|uniref:hypothetical protein n=1 Tax=Actinomyces vulturis TaxID=1857645 RepID=UPI00082DA075|nr:hypothetical protein [Actinomyces vulturis]